MKVVQPKLPKYRNLGTAYNGSLNPRSRYTNPAFILRMTEISCPSFVKEVTNFMGGHDLFEPSPLDLLS